MNTAVYRITNTVNGKLYIGISANPTKRWWEHRRCAKPTHTKLYSAIKKYGVDAFKFDVLYWCTSREDARDLENLAISVCDSIAIGYNMCPGGGGGIAGEENPLFGKKLAPEVCAKMSEAAKKRGMSAEHKVRLAQARTGSKKPEHWKQTMREKRLGMKLSKEWRDNLAKGWEKRKAKNLTPPNAIQVLCKETQEVFSSISEAARAYGMSLEAVRRQCLGETKKPKSGHTFAYTEQVRNKVV